MLKRFCVITMLWEVTSPRINQQSVVCFKFNWRTKQTRISTKVPSMPFISRVLIGHWNVLLYWLKSMNIQNNRSFQCLTFSHQFPSRNEGLFVCISRGINHITDGDLVIVDTKFICVPVMPYFMIKDHMACVSHFFCLC